MSTPVTSDEFARERMEVADILSAWAASVRAQDIDGVLRHHDRDLLLYDVVGPTAIRGLEAYGEAWVAFFSWFGSDGRFELTNLAITTSATVAFATALIECSGIEAGRRVAYTVRLTVGFEKRDGQWLIVHEHHSEPLPMDAEQPLRDRPNAVAGRLERPVSPQEPFAFASAIGIAEVGR